MVDAWLLDDPPPRVDSLGVRAAAVPVELCPIEDVTNAARLIAAFAMRLDTAGFEPRR